MVLWGCVFMHTFYIGRIKWHNVVVMYIHVYFGGELVQLLFLRTFLWFLSQGFLVSILFSVQGWNLPLISHVRFTHNVDLFVSYFTPPPPPNSLFFSNIFCINVSWIFWFIWYMEVILNFNFFIESLYCVWHKKLFCSQVGYPVIIDKDKTIINDPEKKKFPLNSLSDTSEYLSQVGTNRYIRGLPGALPLPCSISGIST